MSLKDCSVESILQKGLYLNFDEDGYMNIVSTGDPYIIMSIEQWVKVIQYIDKSATRISLLKEHFGAVEVHSTDDT